MIVGIHGGVWNGLEQALAEAREAGASVLQLLPYQRHHVPSDAQLAAFRARASGLRLIAHSRFVPSLASSDETRRKRSMELLAMELRLAQGLGASTYILHAGAHSAGASAEQGLALAADSIARAAHGYPGRILIENVPGGGRRLCGPLEDIAALRDALGARVKSGVCLDTAHAWAQGYDVGSAEGMLKFLARAHRLFGDGVAAFHLNDTRAKLGSFREDHAHWGEGYVGREGLRALLERPEYAETPAILETPKTPGGDERNLAFLASIAPRRD